MKHLITLFLAGFISFNGMASQEGNPPDGKTSKPDQENSQEPPSSDTEKTNEQTEITDHKETGSSADETEKNTDGLESQAEDQQPFTEVKASAQTQKTDNNSTEKSILLTTKEVLEESPSQQESTNNLDETNIGRAVIEGDPEAYKAALNELKEFNISIPDILQKRTSDKKNLPDLMIEAEKNRDFFTNEMFNLFVLNILTLDFKNNPQVLSDSIVQTQALIEKASQVNNEMAVLMLTNLQNLLTQYNTEFTTIKENHNKELTEIAQNAKDIAKQYDETIKKMTEEALEEQGTSKQYENKIKELTELIDSAHREQETAKANYENKTKELTEQQQEVYISMRKQTIDLLKKYKNRLYRSIGVMGTGGALSLWGFEKLSSSAKFISPQIMEFLPTISNREVGAVAITVGTALGAIGLYKCYRSITQNQEIKEQQRQLDNAKKTIPKAPQELPSIHEGIQKKHQEFSI